MKKRTVIDHVLDAFERLEARILSFSIVDRFLTKRPELPIAHRPKPPADVADVPLTIESLSVSGEWSDHVCSTASARCARCGRDTRPVGETNELLGMERGYGTPPREPGDDE